MSKHQVGDSPFLKRVLIPFWVIRIIVMIVDIAAYGLAIGVVSAYKNRIDTELSEAYGTNTNGATSTVIAILVVVMLLIMACLALDIVCIVKRARRTLSPRFFLIVNVVQTLLWTILFILSMLGERTGLTVGIGVIIYLSFVGVLIYASVVFHRHRVGARRGAYVPAVNPADQQGLVGDSANYPSYPSFPSHAAYGNVPKPAQYEMETPPAQTYAYASQYPSQYSNQHPNQYGA